MPIKGYPPPSDPSARSIDRSFVRPQKIPAEITDKTTARILRQCSCCWVATAVRAVYRALVAAAANMSISARSLRGKEREIVIGPPTRYSPSALLIGIATGDILSNVPTHAAFDGRSVGDRAYRSPRHVARFPLRSIQRRSPDDRLPCQLVNLLLAGSCGGVDRRRSGGGLVDDKQMITSTVIVSLRRLL